MATRTYYIVKAEFDLFTCYKVKLNYYRASGVKVW